MARSKSPPIAQVVRDLVSAAIELVRAEVTALAAELGSDARSAGRALIYGLVAFALIFWALGLFSAAAVLGLSLLVDPWLAALIPAAVLVVIAGVLLVLLRSRLRALRPPQQLVQERWQEHQRWWNEELQPTMPGSARVARSGASPAGGGDGLPDPDDVPLDRQL